MIVVALMKRENVDMKKIIAIAILFFCGMSVAHSAPPKGFDSVDKVIKLGVIPGRMLYDKNKLQVKAGQKVKIEFVNNGVMPHNLIVLKSGGDTNKIGQMAMTLGAKGAAMGYIPASDQILASIQLLNVKQSGELYFTAPDSPQKLPYVCTFPGHFMLMKGEIVVE
jgi:plastocyanin